MEMQSLKDLYVDELKDLYSAEKQILKALPKMVKAAAYPELKQAFDHHLTETQLQVERLDSIFGRLGAAPRGKTCQGIKGILKEGDELLKAKTDRAVRDAGLIAIAQRVEHYEMAGYGTARTFARFLGYDDAAQALQETLNEEGDADHKLTQLAESQINPQAENTEVRYEEAPVYEEDDV